MGGRAVRMPLGAGVGGGRHDSRHIRDTSTLGRLDRFCASLEGPGLMPGPHAVSPRSGTSIPLLT